MSKHVLRRLVGILGAATLLAPAGTTRAQPVIVQPIASVSLGGPLVGWGVSGQTRHVFVAGNVPGGMARVTMLDAATGQVQQTVALPFSFASSGTNVATAFVFVDDAAHRVILCSCGPPPIALGLLDTASGRLLRTVSVAASAQAGPGQTVSWSPPQILVTAARLVVVDAPVSGTPSGSVTTPVPTIAETIDATTGAPVRRATWPARSWPSSLVVGRGGGRIFVVQSTSAETSLISALSLHTGRLLWQDHAPLRSPAQIAVDPHISRVLVASRSGSSLLVVDAATGRVVNRPGAVIIVHLDRPTHRAFGFSYTDVGQPAPHVDVLDTHDGHVLDNIALGGVEDMAFIRRTNRLFVTVWTRGGGNGLAPEPLGIAVLNATTLQKVSRDTTLGRGLLVDDPASCVLTIDTSPAERGVDVVLDATTGKNLGVLPVSLGDFEVPFLNPVLVDPATGHLYVDPFTRSTAITVIDPRSDQQWTLPLGFAPVSFPSRRPAFLLVPGTHRVFAADVSTGTLTIFPAA